MIYVSDSLAHEIKVYQEGTLLTRFGRRGSTAGLFNFPAGLCVTPAAELLVADQNNDRVQVFDLGGVYRRSFTLRPPGTTSRSGRPQGLAVDSQGRIYVADVFQDAVKVLDPAGPLLSVIGEFGQRTGQLRSPAGVLVDGQNRLLVAAANNRRIEIFGLDCYTQLAVRPGTEGTVAGSTVTFSASSSCPGPLIFQWRKDGANLADGGIISGATSPTLQLNAVTAHDAGRYAVEITGPTGPAVSPESVLTVVSAPSVITQPNSLTVNQGATATLSVVAEGGLLSYRWFFEGLAIPGATASNLVLVNVQAENEGLYTVVVTNPAGSVTSRAISLSVLLAPTFTLQPADQTVPEHSDVTFTVGVTGGGFLRYQWYYNTNAISRQTSATLLLLTNVTPLQSGDYFLIVTNRAGKATSDVATLTVIADNMPPRLLAVEGGRAANTNRLVRFSERLDPFSAQQISNYQLTGPGDLSILRATLASGSNVTLAVSGLRLAYTDYILRVQDVKDTASSANTIAPNPSTMTVASFIELVSITNHSWNYFQTNQAPGLGQQAWTTPDFQDQTWPAGRGLFYGHRSNSVFQPNPNPNIVLPVIVQSADPANSQAWTILNVFTNAGNVIQEVTYYFRTAFDFPARTNKATLFVHSMIDDGAVFYLNGRELERVRLPAPPALIAYTNLASNGNQDWEPLLSAPGRVVPANALLRGPNVLAVELHQSSLTSSDVTRGLLLEANVVAFNEASPSLVATQNAAGDIEIRWETHGYQLQSASSPVGPWTALPTAASPYTVPKTVIQTTREQFFRLQNSP